MTTKSSIRNIKTTLTTTNSVNNMSTNDNDIKSSRICVKRPLSTVNFLPNSSTTNGISNQLKKRTLQINNFFHSKIKPTRSNEQTNGHQCHDHSVSPPLIFHAIAPLSPDEENNSSKQSTADQKTSSPSENLEESNNDLLSPTSRRIANVRAHAKIKTMSTDRKLLRNHSSGSEDAADSSKLSPLMSSTEADADESDNGNGDQLRKSRRFQKTRKVSNSSQPQKSEINTERRHSSSNDESNNESNSILNGTNERRTKPTSVKNIERKLITATLDDNVTEHVHRYHPLDNLETKMLPITNESFPIPTITVASNQPSVKKVNRFQVKSIRTSQQQHILSANATAAKSSNEDDCSVPNEKSNLQLKPSIIERKNSHTPTTDGEHSITNTDSLSNSATPIRNTVENGNPLVQFPVTPQGKKESVPLEVEKIHQQAMATVPTPQPPSSAASMHADDDEEEEAIAKSPDGRFIKYAKEIGRGAFKTVYRGLDTETSVAVAWCELQDFAQFDKQERARFKEEAEMLKKLQHPNIVRFYDFWEETNPRTNKKVIILVTELMTSGSLKGYIRKFKGQTEDKRINVMKKWCRQILKGLAHLHSRNPPVIHRDLKCDNVFISSTNGCVKIGDLGLATFKTQTFAKSMRGTMEFMAPEMFDEKYDELVDIYSFGLCMLEMITGEYPYIECRVPTAVIKRVTAGLKPDCYYKVENEDVREVINCCIRTNKEERLPVNELLQHSFFLENNGLRIDFVRDPSNDLQVSVTNNSINLKLKIVDKNKRTVLWTEHEAIRFRYNFTTDTPEQIVDELIQKKYIFDEDKNFIIQSIKDRLRAYQYEQIDRKAGVFCTDRRLTITQPSLAVQHHHHQALPAQTLPPPTPPLVVQPQVASVPVPIVAQQASIEVPQQGVMKLSSEIPSTKPTGQTEPIPILQVSDLSSSVSGSAGSLEILDAALKKTFYKMNTPQSTSTISTLTNENNETPVSLVSQDESSISQLGIEIAFSDQQHKEDSTGTTIDELTTTLFPSSASSTSQSHSQPTTMGSTHQLQTLPNPLLRTQTSQSFSHSAVTPPPPPPQLVNTIGSTDPIKQLTPSSSSTLPETIENSPSPLSPSQTNEANQSSAPSDATTQPSILGSLKELDALLKNAFKNPGKPTGTAHNSDTETATPTISLTIDDGTSIKPLDLESDKTKLELIHLFDTPNPNGSLLVQSQPNSASIILPKPIQQVKSQPTSQISAHFDPLISPERTFQELDTTMKTSHERFLSNDDTITTASTCTDFSEIKMMLADLSKNFFNRMNILEHKIDEHRNQTIEINHLLNKTVLPSLLDLADIIHQTPNLDLRVRTKLEDIQTNLRVNQQPTEMKDLMEI